jgi:hypothetical protein
MNFRCNQNLRNRTYSVPAPLSRTQQVDILLTYRSIGYFCLLITKYDSSSTYFFNFTRILLIIANNKHTYTYHTYVRFSSSCYTLLFICVLVCITSGYRLSDYSFQFIAKFMFIYGVFSPQRTDFQKCTVSNNQKGISKISIDYF